jgi:hypothetical protein
VVQAVQSFKTIKEKDDSRGQGSTEHVTVQAVQNVPLVQIVSERFDHLERLTSLEFPHEPHHPPDDTEVSFY